MMFIPVDNFTSTKNSLFYFAFMCPWEKYTPTATKSNIPPMGDICVFNVEESGRMKRT